jgi:hypothetical protein
MFEKRSYLLRSMETGCPAVLLYDYGTENTSLATVQRVSHTDNLIHVWSLLLDAVLFVQEVEGTSSIFLHSITVIHVRCILLGQGLPHIFCFGYLDLDIAQGNLMLS